jgi:PST family polysaccharide transporter
MPSPHVSLWRDRILRFAAGAGGTIVSAFAGVIRNKWLATHLETAGIGIVSQVVASQAVFGAVIGLGLGLPVTRAVAAAVGRGDDAAARRIAATAFALVSAAALPAAVLVFAFAGQISALLLGTPDHAALVRVSVFGLAGVGLFGVAQGLCAGRSDVRAPIAFALGGAGAATILTFALVPRFGLFGAAIAAAVLYPVGVVSMLWVHARRHPEALAPRPKPFFDRREAGALLGVAGAALVLPVVDQGVLLALRAHVVRAHGASANGLLQAAIALSQQVGALFYAYLASYALGKISAVGGAPGIQAYTRRQWAPLITAAAIALAFAMVAAAPLLHLLYSSRFDPARTMMAYTLVGEFGRVCLQAVALGSLPLGGAGLWFRIGILQPATLAVCYAGFAATGSGELSLPRAYATAAAVTLGISAWMMARAGVSLGARQLAIAGAGYALLLALLGWTVG